MVDLGRGARLVLNENDSQLNRIHKHDWIYTRFDSSRHISFRLWLSSSSGLIPYIHRLDREREI